MIINDLIPESCMKINVKFEKYLNTTVCENLESKEKYSMGKKDDDRFYLINFHPLGFALQATTQQVGRAGGFHMLRC